MYAIASRRFRAMAAHTIPGCACAIDRFLPFAPLRIRRSAFPCTAATRTSGDSASPLGLASLLLSAPAWAQEAVEQIQQTDVPLPESLPAPEEVAEKAPQVGGSVLDLFTDNPVIIIGALFLAAIPLALNFLGGGSLGVKQVNAAGAIEGLSSDPSTVLIDIRSREEAKEQGSPNLSSTKKKAITVPFTRLVAGDVEDVPDFVEKFSKLRQVKPDSSIIVLDSYGQEAPRAAKQLVKLAGRVYYVRDGAVGANGWKESGQPWKEPLKSLLNLDGLADDFKNQPTFAKAGVAAGAVGVAAAVLFQEASTVLELAALGAAGAFALPRFLGSPSTDVGEGTQKRQVKQFVKEAEKDTDRAAGKAEKAVSRAAGKASRTADRAAGKAKVSGQQLGSEAEQASGKDLGGKAQEAIGSLQDAVQGNGGEPSKAADKAEAAAESAGSQVESAVSDVKEAASQNAEDAKSWIDNWRKQQ